MRDGRRAERGRRETYTRFPAFRNIFHSERLLENKGILLTKMSQPSNLLSNCFTPCAFAYANSRTIDRFSPSPEFAHAL